MATIWNLRLLVCLIFVVLIGCIRAESEAETTTEKIEKKIFDPVDVDKFVETLMKCRNIPSATVSVIRLNDENEVTLSFTKGYGRTDPACDSNCDTVDENTKFCIGSVSKAFTAGIIGKLLLDNKKFKDTLWDTPLKRLLPCDQRDFFNGDPTADLITVRDLLAHRMGLPDRNFAWLMGTDTPRTEVWKNIYRMEHDHPVSTNWRSSFNYNNWMYALAGHITELLSNKTWEDLVKKFYFTPLNMKASTFAHEGPSNWAKFAKFGIYRQDKWKSSNDIMNLLRNPSPVAPAGAICSTSVDMHEYLKFLLSTSGDSDQNVVPKKIINDTFKSSSYLNDDDATVLCKPKLPVYVGYQTYGMGWFRGVYREYQSLGHGGGLYGYVSNIFLLPDVKLGVFVSATRDMVSEDAVASAIRNHVVDLALGEKPWLEIDSNCEISPQAYLGNQTARNGGDNQTDYEFVCEDLLDEFSRYEGVYQSSVSGVLHVIPNRAKGYLEFKLGVSGHGRLCRTNPPIDDSPNALRFYFDGVFEHYNTPEWNSKLNATVIFEPPKGGGEVPTATIGFLENSVYHWIGPLPTTTSTTQMPTALPFAGPNRNNPNSSTNLLISNTVFSFSFFIFTLLRLFDN